MGLSNNISIKFPFLESEKGYYLDMTTTDSEDVKSSLMHLLLTNKGERFMMPEFGTDLLKYVFSPNINKTINDLKTDINVTVSKFIPNIQITDILIDESKLSNELILITIEYTTSDGTYSVQDSISFGV